MENLITFGWVAVVTALSLALAVGLEWLLLRAAFLLLPGRSGGIRVVPRLSTRGAVLRWAFLQSRGLPGAEKTGLHR